MKKVAETRERLEDYSGVIRCLAYDDKDYGTALLKADKYEKLGHTLDDDVKPQQIAYMYIRNTKGKQIEMLDAFRFVSDGSAKATLLRELGKLEEAADEFLKAGHLNQACRILEAQSLFKKGCEILSTNNEETQAKFLLYHATFLATKSGWKKTEEIIQFLKQLSKLPFFYFRGRSQILLALVEKDGSMLYQAINNFKHFECLPGEILAFCSLKHLQEETKPEKDLQYSKAAHDVAEAIRAARSKNNTFKQKSIYQEVHRFHDLNCDYDENSYYISLFLLENNICPTLCSLDCSMRDEDGMVKLRTVQVDDCLSNYYSQLSIDFLKSTSNYFTQLPVRLRTSEFYLALKSNTVRKSLSLDLDNYFKILKELLEYSYLMKASFDVCESKLMFRLFSPDVAFHLYITRKNINYFKRNSKVVNELMTSIAMEMLNDSECTLQTYFTAYRLLIAFIGKYEAQKQITQVMNLHIHPKYIFNQENTGRKLHIFNGWIETHNRIVRGDVTGAVYSAYNFFFRRIANLDGNIKTEAISISTINYIVSILSTALLTILQQCQSMLTPYAHSHADYLIPRLFNLMLVANFELFCSNSIFNACMQQVLQQVQKSQLSLPLLYNTSMTQLNILLSFLLGEDGSNYNVLLTALTTECCIQDGSAFYCLIQSLMIASNLYIASSSNTEKLNRVHAQFLKIHKIVRMSSRMNSTVPEFVSSAIKCLSGARNIKDVFTFVSEILPTRFQSSDLCKVRVPNEMVYRSHYPSVPMRALVIIESPDDDPIVEQQVLSDDDSPVNNDVPSPIELNEPAFNSQESTDEILNQLADLPKGLVSDEYCSVCEVILFQGAENLTEEKQTAGSKEPEEYHAHLKSSGHATKLQEYKEFIEKKETIEQKISNLNVEIKTLHEVNSSIKLNKLMTDLETLKNQEVSVSNDTMKFVVTWSEGMVELEEHHKRLQEYEELFHKLKDEYEERIKPIEIQKEDEVEILPTETGPPKLSKKPRKVTTQNNHSN